MVIKNEIEYRDFENQIELLIKRGTELGDMELLSDDEKAKFIELSTALDEYGKSNYPMPSQVSRPVAQHSYEYYHSVDEPMEAVLV